MPLDQLLQAIVAPAEAVNSLDWRSAVPLARRNKLLGSLAFALGDNLLLELPSRIQRILKSERRAIEFEHRKLKREIHEIARVLQSVNIEPVFLKGAAYLVRDDQQISAGRRLRDIDVLVRAEELAIAECCLKDQGWSSSDVTLQHDYYFRNWLHEIPPLAHRERGVTLDLHHQILPRTDRIQIPTNRLCESSHLNGDGFRTLDSQHMVIHSSLHLFRNGDFRFAARDLLDVYRLLTDLETRGRLTELFKESEDLGIQRIMNRAIHTINQLFDSSFPARKPQNPLLTALVNRAIRNSDLDGPTASERFSIAALSYFPIPKWNVWLTPVFWTKRFNKKK